MRHPLDDLDPTAQTMYVCRACGGELTWRSAGPIHLPAPEDCEGKTPPRGHGPGLLANEYDLMENDRGRTMRKRTHSHYAKG